MSGDCFSANILSLYLSDTLYLFIFFFLSIIFALVTSNDEGQHDGEQDHDQSQQVDNQTLLLKAIEQKSFVH